MEHEICLSLSLVFCPDDEFHQKFLAYNAQLPSLYISNMPSDNETHAVRKSVDFFPLKLELGCQVGKVQTKQMKISF